jgi:hypothetical protein
MREGGCERGVAGGEQSIRQTTLSKERDVTEINYVSKIQQLHVKIGLPTRTISSNLIYVE